MLVKENQTNQILQWKLWCVTGYPFLETTSLQKFIASSLWLQLNSSLIPRCSPVLGRFCSFASAEPVPSGFPAVLRWDACWGQPTQTWVVAEYVSPISYSYATRNDSPPLFRQCQFIPSYIFLPALCTAQAKGKASSPVHTLGSAHWSPHHRSQLSCAHTSSPPSPRLALVV